MNLSPPAAVAAGGGAPAGDGSAVKAGAAAVLAAAMASSTSCLRIRPPMSAPLTDVGSTLWSLASFRTNGVKYAAASDELNAGAAVVGAAGAEVAGGGRWTWAAEVGASSRAGMVTRSDMG